MFVVNMQNDFCRGGSLPVASGSAEHADRPLLPPLDQEALTHQYDVVVDLEGRHVDQGPLGARARLPRLPGRYAPVAPTRPSTPTSSRSRCSTRSSSEADTLAAYLHIRGRTTSDRGLADWFRARDSRSTCAADHELYVSSTALTPSPRASRRACSTHELCTSVAPRRRRRPPRIDEAGVTVGRVRLADVLALLGQRPAGVAGTIASISACSAKSRRTRALGSR